MNRSCLRALAAAITLALASDFATAATLTVNSLADDATPGDGLVSLREAIDAANADTATDLGQSGDGADTLDLSALSGTITLHGTLPTITSAILLVGPAAGGLTISGADGKARHRLLLVRGGDLEVRSIDLADGAAKGGHGGACEQRTGCGGGGAGLGANVFLYSGSVSLRNLSVRNGTALGGEGGSRGDAFNTGGGGGGGLSLDAADPVEGGGTAGADGAPLDGIGGSVADANNPAGNGGEGAGGGGGGAYQQRLPGGNGGFGGGGGGGGYGLIAGVPGGGGDGGFGGGGGGSGGQGSATAEGSGGAGGQFGGAGSDTTDLSNIAGGGGGGAGLGGGVFALSGSLRLENVSFVNCIAGRGYSGINSSNAGVNGQGKGGAVFVADEAVALAHGLSFEGGNADDSSGNGYTVGSASDTRDVYGTIGEIDAIFADGFDG